MISTLSILLGLTSLLPTTLACDYGTASNPRRRAEDSAVPIANFSYTGLRGPYGWATMDGGINAICDSGLQQSPININTASTTTAKAASELSIAIQSYPEGRPLENIGSTVEVPLNGTLTDGDKLYDLVQFHFHTPGDHRVDEMGFPAEMHFVFQAQTADKAKAVVAFFLNLGTAEPVLLDVLGNVAKVANPGTASTTGPLEFNAIEASFAANKVYRYAGSLTTPPCSEGVSWIISDKPLLIDDATFTAMEKVIKYNARYTQDGLNGVMPSVQVSLGAAGAGVAA